MDDTIFLQRAAIWTSFDVCWSLVAQAIPKNELFLSKLSKLPESLVQELLVYLGH